MSIWFRLVCAGVALSLAGCAVKISESDILLAGAAPALDRSVFEARAPGYGFQPQTIVAPDGVRLSAVLLRRPGAILTILLAETPSGSARTARP